METVETQAPAAVPVYTIYCPACQRFKTRGREREHVCPGPPNLRRRRKLAELAAAATEITVEGVERAPKPGLLSLLKPKARRAVEHILDGHRHGSSKPPTPADILRAAEIVLDREAPKVTKIESRTLTGRVTLTPEREARYRLALGLPPMGVQDRKDGAEDGTP